MSKHVEQRYPSGPAKVGEQKPGGRSNTQPAYKADPLIQQKKPSRPDQGVRQEPQKSAKDAAEPLLRAAKGDDDVMSQEPKKS